MGSEMCIRDSTNSGNTFDQEIHFLSTVVDINDFLVHQSESNHRQEDNFMFFEESARYPLVDSKSDILNKFSCSGLISLRCFFDSLEEKFDKAFQRVLVHVINNAE